jgi:hypothetical protein
VTVPTKHEGHKHESGKLPKEPASRPESIGSQIKPFVDMLQGLLTMGAICAGGWWFFEQESVKPEVKLEQTVTQRALGNDLSQVLLTIDVRATNLGKTKVELTKGQMELSQINPIPGGSLETDPLQPLILEPWGKVIRRFSKAS